MILDMYEKEQIVKALLLIRSRISKEEGDGKFLYICPAIVDLQKLFPPYIVTEVLFWEIQEERKRLGHSHSTLWPPQSKQRFQFINCLIKKYSPKRRKK